MTRKVPVFQPPPRDERPIRVDKLLLDPENPRLITDGPELKQDELLEILWKEMAVDEIALSIAQNGFFPEERLFVVPAEHVNGKYIVVEGNRRLAAVKLLLEDKLRERMGATVLPSLDARARRALEELPTSIYPNRRELWRYFGFRHINGPKPWDSFSKAAYVAEVHEDYGIDLETIADTIGDRHATVTRLYRGYLLLRQAERQGSWDREDRVGSKLSFSHLYTAAAQPEFQKFLGLASDKPLKPNPVPKTKLPELRELCTWLFGSQSRGVEPVVRTQNPDLNRLRDVIANPQSLDALRAGYGLDRAHDVSIGDTRRFREALISAKEDLQQAKATVTTGYNGEPELLTVIDDISTYAQSVKTEMAAKAAAPKRAKVAG
jgi:hypothetical protein